MNIISLNHTFPKFFLQLSLFSLLLSFLWIPIAIAAEETEGECYAQKVQESQLELCLYRHGSLQHDIYTLKADNVLIFSLVDDFIGQVQLVREMRDEDSIEFRLSNQGLDKVTIHGGCLSERDQGVEVARVCNFHWGKLQIVKDVRFDLRDNLF